MPRPKKNTPPPKEHFIGIRITNDQYEALKFDAKNAKQTISEYIRNIISNCTPIIKYETTFDSLDLLKTLGDMGKIGSNLNQIAHHLNAGGTLNESLRNQIIESIKDIKDIRDDIRKQTGEYRGNTKAQSNKKQ